MRKSVLVVLLLAVACQPAKDPQREQDERYQREQRCSYAVVKLGQGDEAEWRENRCDEMHSQFVENAAKARAAWQAKERSERKREAEADAFASAYERLHPPTRGPNGELRDPLDAPESNTPLAVEGRKQWEAEWTRRQASASPKPTPTGPPRTGSTMALAEGRTRFECKAMSSGVHCGVVKPTTEVEVVFDPTLALCKEVEGEKAAMQVRAEQLTPMFGSAPAAGSPKATELKELGRQRQIVSAKLRACQSQAWREYERALGDAGDRCAKWTRIVQQYRVQQAVEESTTAASKLDECRTAGGKENGSGGSGVQ